MVLQEGDGEGEDSDTELLREQMRVMADELDQREAALEALQNSDTAENYEVELQVSPLPPCPFPLPLEGTPLSGL
jgi:hypothetical protein